MMGSASPLGGSEIGGTGRFGPNAGTVEDLLGIIRKDFEGHAMSTEDRRRRMDQNEGDHSLME